MNGGKSGTVKELKLTSSITSTETTRTIYITLPSTPQYSRIIQLCSDSGNIQMNQCKSTAMISAETKQGFIKMQNCISPTLGVETQNGDVDVNNCTMKEFISKTGNGTVSLQLTDRSDNYKMNIETKMEGKIVINGKEYHENERILNENAPKNIVFDCYGNGSLIITESTDKSIIYP